MFKGPLTEEELDEPPPPCEVCAEPVKAEDAIDVEIDRHGAVPLYLLFCSEQHLREHLSQQPLPPPEPEPDPFDKSGSAAEEEGEPAAEEGEQGRLPGCVIAMLVLMGVMLLLPVLSSLGVPLWGQGHH
ncbi:hypothetical protein [Kitasatospora viridis]|uniref:Uncharacterized protein n=1 Tax=Kitasatospora viridis TaxID=281105 RepID=A0A561T799_9ACTN|nr:hypothetical protein [Kitasatospora viridis]TWF82986.1 hypothetical protein FHX73_14469 [Kitasatospora viridis]